MIVIPKWLAELLLKSEICGPVVDGKNDREGIRVLHFEGVVQGYLYWRPMDANDSSDGKEYRVTSELLTAIRETSIVRLH